MTDLISRRAVTFSGDIADSNYDSERYYVGGVDLEDEMADLQKQVFPFAHNEDQEVIIRFQIKVTDESSLELGAGDFGVERYVGVAQANTALGQRRPLARLVSTRSRSPAVSLRGAPARGGVFKRMGLK